MGNSIYRVFLEKLGGVSSESFIGSKGDLFYDPDTRELKISDEGIKTPLLLNTSDQNSYLENSSTSGALQTNGNANTEYFNGNPFSTFA